MYSSSARSPPPLYTSQQARTEHTPLIHGAPENDESVNWNKLSRRSRQTCYGFLGFAVILSLTTAWWLLTRWPECSSVIDKSGSEMQCQAYWGEVQRVDKCTSHGTREYWAQMYDIPPGHSWIKTCEATPIKFRGQDIGAPSRCEQNILGGIRGYWQIDGELDCTPFWDRFRDKGCTGAGSGFHRWEARLWNIKRGDDWMTMCSTTPATIQGIQFDHPTYCVDEGIAGIMGMWETQDTLCLRR